MGAWGGPDCHFLPLVFCLEGTKYRAGSEAGAQPARVAEERFLARCEGAKRPRVKNLGGVSGLGRLRGRRRPVCCRRLPGKRRAARQHCAGRRQATASPSGFKGQDTRMSVGKVTIVVAQTPDLQTLLAPTVSWLWPTVSAGRCRRMRNVSQLTIAHPLGFDINTLSRPLLVDALQSSGIEMNATAMMLLEDPIFDDAEPRHLTVVERSVRELGLDGGGVLSQIFEAARKIGLQLCPPTTGPYLRLALPSQATAPDTVLSTGRAPSGSLTVASPPLRPGSDYPKGFYVRVIGGQPWLRGYRCDDEFVWDPVDRFVFGVRTRRRSRGSGA